MSIELIAKIAPKNDGFVGMVDADQVIGGVEGGTLLDEAVASSNVTQHEGDINHNALTNTHDMQGTSILSGDESAGKVLQANGDGTSAWDFQSPEGSNVLSTGADVGTVLTADGAGGSSWEEIPDPFTTSSGLASLLSDETGTGAAVFANNPVLVAPTLTTPQINDTSADHQYIFAVSELTADRTVTLPLLTGSDEFVFKDHIQTLTNKTLTSPTLTTPQINDTSADHQYVFAVSELTADRNVTLPLLTGDDEFVFKAHTQTLTNKTLTSPKLGTTVCKADGTAMLNEAQLGVDEICWHIQNPRVNAYYIAKYVDNYITLLECRSMTDVGTVTFNIEKRAYTAPFAAGTELLTADMVADATGEITTDFVGATDVVDGATTGQWIVLAISAIATAPTQLVVHLKYKRYGVSV